MKSVALMVSLLFLSLSASTLADVTGPVVGFVRVDVAPGPQRLEATVRPRAPQATEGETTAQVLSEYLGAEFRAGTETIEADWVGMETEAGNVTMIWKDQQGEWHDLLENPVEPECADAAAFWLDLAFDEWTDGETRELVLSGQVVW